MKTTDILDNGGYSCKIYSEEMNPDFVQLRDDEQLNEMVDLLSYGGLAIINYVVGGQEYQSYIVNATDSEELGRISDYLSWCMENVEGFVAPEEIEDKITRVKDGLKLDSELYEETAVVWQDLQ